MDHPDRVGPFKLLAPIGKGGMASVYRAVHETDGSVVALKVFSDDFSGNDEFVRRAQREVVALTMCAHPNIPRVLGHDIRADGGWVAIEFIDGDNLEDVLAAQGPLEVTHLFRVARDVAGALGYCHVRSLFHRDLKPANIVLERSTGRSVLLDFGIVKAANLTNISVVGRATMGTLSYMAPEQWVAKDVDGRTDLYQLGLVLYQLATNKIPPPVVELMDQEEPGIPAQLLTELHAASDRLPKGFEIFIRNAVHLDPEIRYATALEMLRDLARLEANEPIEDRNLRYKTPAEARKSIRKALTTPRPEGEPEAVYEVDPDAPPIVMPKGLKRSGRIPIPGARSDGVPPRPAGGAAVAIAPLTDHAPHEPTPDHPGDHTGDHAATNPALVWALRLLPFLVGAAVLWLVMK